MTSDGDLNVGREPDKRLGLSALMQRHLSESRRGQSKEVATWVTDQLAAAVGEDRRRLIKHARYYRLLLAESRLARPLFGGMLGRIEVPWLK